MAIVGSYAGMPVLDPLGGIAVSAMLAKSSVGLIKSSMSELMDKGITSEEMESIIQAVSKVKVNTYTHTYILYCCFSYFLL